MQKQTYLTQRRILFRGKRMSDGEWMKGFLTESKTDWHEMKIECWSTRKNGKPYFESGPVDPITVGQFTGYLDKDGKEIFEGDICQIGNLKYKVDFRRSRWQFTIVSTGQYVCRLFPLSCGEHCTIIGNVHDNPEYLLR